MPNVKNKLTGQTEWVDDQEYRQRMQDAINPPKPSYSQPEDEEDMNEAVSVGPTMNMADFINAREQTMSADEIGGIINEPPPKPKFNRVKALLKK